MRWAIINFHKRKQLQEKFSRSKDKVLYVKEKFQSKGIEWSNDGWNGGVGSAVDVRVVTILFLIPLRLLSLLLCYRAWG